MKFFQLAIGQRFEFEGEVYVKTTHLLACHEQSGRKRMIRRAANVAVRGVANSMEQTVQTVTQEAENPNSVLIAFDAFYSHCLQCVLDMATQVDPQTLDQVNVSLKEARRRFIASIQSRAEAQS
jgi:hypothetical protein